MNRDTPFDRWSALLTASAALVAALLQIGWTEAEASNPTAPALAALADCRAGDCAAHDTPACR